MDHEPAELSRERAASSEPCSTRPNPFDDNEASSRKRPRISRGGSRSRSVDTARASDTSQGLMPLLEESMKSSAEPSPPHTPTRSSLEPLPAEPNSSRVTINLRTAQPVDALRSPSPDSPATPSKMTDGGEATEAGLNAESESDALSTIAAVTPSSSPSASSIPEIEVVPLHEDDSDSPPVAIIRDDENMFPDPMLNFPFQGSSETIAETTGRLIKFFAGDSLDSDGCFVKLTEWIENYLVHTSQPNTWYESYRKDHEFWTLFPDVIGALSWRSRFFGRFLDSNRPSARSLSEFLCQFARLAARFVSMDIRSLSKYEQGPDDSPEPDLGCRAYLREFAFLLRNKEEPAHIGKNLEIHYRWNWDEVNIRLINSFQTEGGSLPNLVKLAQGQIGLISRNPRIIDNLCEPCRLVSKLVSDASNIVGEAGAHRSYVEPARQQISQGYAFFKVMSAALESIIQKHVTFLNHESAVVLIESLTTILRNSVAFEYSSTRELVEAKQQEHPDLSRHLLPEALSIEWKFGILTKLIKSAQMQLRVVGVTSMCNDLLRLFNTYKGRDPMQSPPLLYFAEFIIENKIIEYLVGIGSHPEIINESYNILGFLIVTGTYGAPQATAIWQTVSTSQDPRVVEAIVRTLKKCLNLQDYEGLLGLCQKMNTLPIEAFSVVMRDFCQTLFQHFVLKADTENRNVDPAAYDLCIRLIRKSSTITPELPNGYPDIQSFAANQFQYLIKEGKPDRETRGGIHQDCIRDISASSITAPGSICVIYSLLCLDSSNELHTLTTEYKLTELVVQELISTILELGQIFPSVTHSPASNARRDLLLMIITREPETISSDLGNQLWNLLVGRESASDLERVTSWQILNKAMKQSSRKNAFIDACLKIHFPTLPPSCFTVGALEFARGAIWAWLEEIRTRFVTEDLSFESPELEQLWRMILTAPTKTIDAQAINLLVEVYVDNALILSIPRAKARSIHSALVGRCLSQLATAATKLKSFNNDAIPSGEDDGMIIVASESEFQEQEVIFARSLAVLREFLTAYQSKSQFATPKSRSPIAVSSSIVEGPPLVVKYQSFDGNTNTEIKSLTLGADNTAASLLASLGEATGFKSYKVYFGGKEFDLEEMDVCKSLKDLNLNSLVLVQKRIADENATSDKTPLDLEIVKHFDDLWGYLDMHEKVAREIYYFLVKFPVYDQLLKDFESKSYSEIFPQGQPFKSLYAVHALREYIATQSQKGTVNEIALTRAISLVVEALSDRRVLDHCSNDELKEYLALSLVDCFVKLITEPVVPASVTPLLNDNLLESLLRLLKDAKSGYNSQNAIHLSCRSFEAILNASLYSSTFWNSVKLQLGSSSLLRELLLEDPRNAIRGNTTQLIISKLRYVPSLACVSTVDFALSFWPLASALIPDTIRFPEQCEDLFALCLLLFKKLVDIPPHFRLEDLVKQWGSLLLSHMSREEVGRPESVDLVAQGLANLCLNAATFAKASKQPLSCGTLGAELLRTHLFPDLSSDDQHPNHAIVPRTPLLSTTTRHTIAETILFLVKDDEKEYKRVLSLLSSLVPYINPYLHGEEGPYMYELPFLFERSRYVRSQTGYVGLRNLSNTCYLNSLFTQLFMNVPFRNFMLRANVADGGASQKLLQETQQLFSFMQNSLRRFVDPANLAASIRTYEDTNIDVSIQMDVDEFYNLLFDRWEGQILAPELKKEFRAFYGGQLVQQVKSKECSHISERLEPFSAIQCDIKGKTCLQESLQAYVDGEIMEGNNKYKCSTCDRHVDAVKRACLKDIPDNLIFHLKRFDFNLRTLQRSKINDYFAFPKTIDMRPYKVEHLMDSPEESPEDVFELVGILVHSGNAESGHYYSFIRERPSSSDRENWVEFNDDSVTPWDPNTMETNCFGGIDYRSPVDSGNIQFDKNYSAYMLFYQRSSSLRTQNTNLQRSELLSPLRLPVPTRLANHIAMENELLVRKYSLYDPSHAAFVIKMLSNIKQINKGHCSDSHSLEKATLVMALNHLDQVISRTKDLPDFPAFMQAVRQMCHSCAECSRDFLEWFIERPEALRQMILRNPDGLVRSEMASSIISALTKVKADATYAYGFGDEEDSSDGLENEDPHLIQKVVHTINSLWDIFHISTRAWPEYFGLLNSIACLGEPEAVLLMDAGFLRKALEMITADHLLPLSPQYTKMLNIISKRIATRPVSYDSVIALLYRLLSVACDFQLEAISDDEERLEAAISTGIVPLSMTERSLLTQHWTRGQSHILTEKLLQIHQNHVATQNILIILLHHMSHLDSYIFNAIARGIRKGAMTVPCGPFLRAAITYCEHSEAPGAISKMATHVCKVTNQIDNTEGKEFLQFFKDLVDLPSNHHGMPKEEILKLCLALCDTWAPGLLNYYDAAVREGTENFLSEILLRHGPHVDFGPSEAEVAKAQLIVEVAQNLGLACLEHLQNSYVSQRQQAVRAALESILGVIESCTLFFEEETDDERASLFFDKKMSVLPALKKVTVEEADEEVSDWDGSEGEYDGSSEPMDSIAELGGADLDI